MRATSSPPFPFGRSHSNSLDRDWLHLGSLLPRHYTRELQPGSSTLSNMTLDLKAHRRIGQLLRRVVGSDAVGPRRKVRDIQWALVSC